MSLLGLFFVFIIIFLTTIFALKIRGMLWQPVVSSPQVRIFGYYSHILTRLKYRRNIQTEFQQSEWIKVRGWLASLRNGRLSFFGRFGLGGTFYSTTPLSGCPSTGS